MISKYLDKLFLLEDKLKKWIEDNVLKWSFTLIMIGTSLALFQSYLMDLDSKSTIIIIFFYSFFLLIVEYSVRKNEDDM